jgi:ankyrin repeat protein
LTTTATHAAQKHQHHTASKHLSSPSLVPMPEAVKTGNLEIVKLLIEHSASTDKIPDKTLAIAATFGYLEILKVLLANGAKVSYFFNYYI